MLSAPGVLHFQRERIKIRLADRIWDQAFSEANWAGNAEWCHFRRVEALAVEEGNIEVEKLAFQLGARSFFSLVWSRHNNGIRSEWARRAFGDPHLWERSQWEYEAEVCDFLDWAEDAEVENIETIQADTPEELAALSPRRFWGRDDHFRYDENITFDTRDNELYTDLVWRLHNDRHLRETGRPASLFTGRD